MKYILSILILFFAGLSLKSQTNNEPIEGTISYKTSQNVYVKFKTTENIAVGDTLFSKQGDVLIPVLKVDNLSSISCVCSRISTIELAVNGALFAKPKEPVEKMQKSVALPEETSTIILTETNDSLSDKIIGTKKPQQQINGRLAVSSYTNFSNSIASNSQRMRYTFSLNANNLGGSKLSAETYISFVHRMNEWSEVQSNIYNGLKIYSLAFNYDFNEKYRITLGRKINPKISNIGAIDGLQFEMRLKAFTIGIVGGTRPDYQDYSFNAKLFQYGAYLAHDYAAKNGTMQTSMAFIEQTNSGNTDRRFVYLQHYNSLIKNLYFFGSIEVNLYKKINEVQDNSPTVNNLYFLLRYKVMRQLSFSVSYSNRKNVIYYETYKDIVERLLETESLQGFIFQVNSSPVKKLSVGFRAGYRFRTQDPKPTTNFNLYATYSQIPGIKVALNASATYLETSYISGFIYTVGVTRDLIPGKMSGGLNYRYVDYNFSNFESSQAQNIAEINLTWRILKKLSCSVFYEGTFEKPTTFNRIYINITQRF
jgi:hypothetical protein